MNSDLVAQLSSPNGTSDFERGLSDEPFRLPAESRVAQTGRRYPVVSSDLDKYFVKLRDEFVRKQLTDAGLRIDQIETLAPTKPELVALSGVATQEFFNLANDQANRWVRRTLKLLRAKERVPSIVPFFLADIFRGDRNDPGDLAQIKQEVMPILESLLSDAASGLNTDQVIYDAGSGAYCAFGDAYTHQGSSDESQFCAPPIDEAITSFPNFEGAEMLVRSLIHEGLHRQHGWRRPDTYEFQDEFETLSREVALKNPDSYTALVARLHSYELKQPPKPPPPEPETHPVLPDDTLWDLADAYYDDPALWPILWEANKETLRSGNPHRIFPGEVLVIPKLEGRR